MTEQDTYRIHHHDINVVKEKKKFISFVNVTSLLSTRTLTKSRVEAISIYKFNKKKMYLD